MTLADIQNHYYWLTGTDATSFSAANQLISINKWVHKIVGMILESQDDMEWDDDNRTDFGVLDVALVAAQRDYSLPVSDDVLKVRRVDITYDGSNYYRAQWFSGTNEPEGLGTDATVDARHSKASPFVRFKGRGFWVYPRANAADVTAGAKIRIEVDRAHQAFTSGDLTTGTKLPGFDEPFHDLVAMGVALDWLLTNGPDDKLQRVKGELIEGENRLRRHYGSRNLDRQNVMKSIYGDGSYGE